MGVTNLLAAGLGSFELGFLFGGHLRGGLGCLGGYSLGGSTGWVALTLVLLTGTSTLLACLNVAPVFFEPAC